MKKVIYTCLVGSYDKLNQPIVVDNSYDYICFSNDIPQEKIGVWKIKRIPITDVKDATRVSRYAKILPHVVLPEYDYSIYLDANIIITGSEFYKILEKSIGKGHLICQVPHLECDCIYDEIRRAYYAGRVGVIDAIKQYRHLIQNHYPKHQGLFENNIILRKHLDPNVMIISKEWWAEYNRYSKRDQFSLMYIYWKHNQKPTFLIDENHNGRNVDYLSYLFHNKQNSIDIAASKFREDSIIRKCARFLHSLPKKIVIFLYLSK